MKDCNALVFKAASEGHAKCLEFLLENKGKVHWREPGDGYTPLHMAVHGGHEDCLKILIEHGADVNVQDLNGFTALDETDGPHGSNACAQILLDNKAVASD